ncbi:hypothetical protein ACWEQ1_23870 [Streptomyces nodosus]
MPWHTSQTEFRPGGVPVPTPSVASLYRALAEAGAAAADDGLPMRPEPGRICRPGDPLTP